MNVISFKSYAKLKNVEDIFDDKRQTHEDLIAMIGASKCRVSFKNLFDIYAPKIKAFMIGQGANSTEAEDIAQETMIKIWRKADSFDANKAKASTWIFTIARNIRIDYLRKVQRANSHKNQNYSEEFYEENLPFKMDIEQLSNSLRDNLRLLPIEQLEVIKLSFYESMSHSEIAKALSLPIGTVKSRLRLALNRLRNQSLGSEL